MAAPAAAAVPIRVLRGSDEVLLNQAVVALVAELVGDGDRSLLVDEFSGADYELGAVVDAAQTPPFLTERRIVVARQAGRFSKADDVGPLLGYLADPLPSTDLVVVWEAAPGQERLSVIPKKLKDAIAAAGGVEIATDAGSGKARGDWWAEQLAAAPVKLDARAARLVQDQVADDVGEWPSILSRLVAVHGEGAKLGVDDVEPYLGRAGSVPPWELTDAIDKGDTAAALDKLHRMLDSGGRHPLQVMATLQGHYVRMLKLDGAGLGNERDAAERLGMKGSTFPAKKALQQGQKLGRGGVSRSIALLAEADATLRGGGVAWPGDLVLEVLVARLSRLAGSGARR